MKIIPPIIMTDAIFTSSNVTEPSTGAAVEIAWVSGTTYAIGDVRSYSTTNSHRIYKRLTASAGTITPLLDGTNWLDIGSNNKWNMHDQSVQSQTINAISIANSYAIVGRCNSVGFLNMDCASVTVSMVDSNDGTVYNKTISMVSDSGINNWYSYFTEPIVRKTDYVLTDLPAYANATVNVTISAPAGTAKCGAVILGIFKDVGATQYGTKVGITSYDVKTQDAFGNYTVTKRGYRKTGDFTLMVPGSYTDQLQIFLTNLRSTPTLYIGSDSYASTIIYGFFGDFSQTIPYPTMSLCTINIQGLT